MISKNKLILVKEQELNYNIQVKSNIDTINFLENILKLQEEPEEVFICITLDTKNTINGYFEIARGGINFCNISIQNLFKRILISNCNKFIVAHNHPSGDNTESKEDIITTRKIEEIANILGLQLLDSLIVADTSKSIMNLI